MKAVIGDRMRLKNIQKREINLKFVVIGEYGVGKTSIINRYVEDHFPEQYRITIGTDFTKKTIEWDENTRISLHLWDIAGHERFNAMTSVFYRHTAAAAIVFDLTRPETFDSVKVWLADVRRKVQLPGGEDIPIVILANKGDMSYSKIPFNINDFCEENNILAWFITSAKCNIQIDEAMLRLINVCLDQYQMVSTPEETNTSNGNIKLKQDSTDEQTTWKCFKT